MALCVVGIITTNLCLFGAWASSSGRLGSQNPHHTIIKCNDLMQIAFRTLNCWFRPRLALKYYALPLPVFVVLRLGSLEHEGRHL